MPHVLAAAAALAIAFATTPAPQAQPTPFPLGTLQPFGTQPPADGAPASNLPQIGRVRAATPPCVAMRDLIIPSFAAARRADVRFAQTRIRLPQYIDSADEHLPEVYRESALAKLDADATAILNETLVLSKALGDARFKDLSDPRLAAEKAQLQQLYDAQQGRANQLQEFVMRQRNEIAKSGLGDNSAFAGRNQPVTYATNVPAPALTAPPGMPVLNGKIAMADKNSINQWSGSMAAAVRASENQAARIFLPIAYTCR